MLAVAQGVFGETAFEWPREGTLAIKVGTASFDGVEAKRADVNMRFDSAVSRSSGSSIGDLGGAAVAVKGESTPARRYPRGAMTLDLDARSLDGIATLVEKFAPRTADRASPQAGASGAGQAARLPDGRIRKPRPAAYRRLAKFRVEGNAGTFRLNMQGNAGAASDAFTAADLSKLWPPRSSLTGRLDASDGDALVEFLGLDRLLAVDKRAGRLNFAASGPLDGDLTVFGQLTAGGLDLSANGSARIAGRQGPDRRSRHQGARCQPALAAPDRAGRTAPNPAGRAHGPARLGRRNDRGSPISRARSPAPRSADDLEYRADAACQYRRRYPGRCAQSSRPSSATTIGVSPPAPERHRHWRSAIRSSAACSAASADRSR